jgi:hypothetical protein
MCAMTQCGVRLCNVNVARGLTHVANNTNTTHHAGRSGRGRFMPQLKWLFEALSFTCQRTILG